MRVKVSAPGLDALVSDMARITTGAERDMRGVVVKNLREGNRIAKENATRSAGSHGVHYPERFSTEMTDGLVGEYGPSGHPQGEMSFEFGSRNQAPHLDLAKSADVIGPKFGRDVEQLPNPWFW